MSDEELIETLRLFEKKRVEQLPEGARQLFYAIMKIADERDRLNKKYNKALEILNEYGMPCERDNFNLLDTDYCETNCSNDEEQFKKCWDEFIKWRLGDKECI